MSVAQHAMAQLNYVWQKFLTHQITHLVEQILRFFPFLHVADIHLAKLAVSPEIDGAPLQTGKTSNTGEICHHGDHHIKYY